MIQHRVFNWIGGDDWRYFVQLTDENNQPYDLANVSEIKWLLHNPFGEIIEHDYLISQLDIADGRISISIPADETTRFPGGVYTDWIRIVCGGITSTLLTGSISVTADPWKAKVAAAPFATISGLSSADVVIMIDHASERVRRRRIPDRTRRAQEENDALHSLPEESTGT